MQLCKSFRNVVSTGATVEQEVIFCSSGLPNKMHSHSTILHHSSKLFRHHWIIKHLHMILRDCRCTNTILYSQDRCTCTYGISFTTVQCFSILRNIPRCTAGT